ncbi:MAG: type II secretion system F family protein [Clostridiales bacterium]|jgi:type II secretory pathway component PulF|nr:type II secretion system F family protein [Clostridiales bacterium]
MAENFWNQDILSLINRKIPPKTLAEFCRKLSILLGAGISLERSLLILSQAAETSQSPLRRAVTGVHARVTRGEGFAQALRAVKVFPEFMCGLCAVGEKSARLPEVTAQLAGYYERNSSTADELAAAMVYPAVVSLMMLAVAIMVSVYMLPGYAAAFGASGAEMPALTRLFMAAAHTLVNRYPLILLTAALFAAAAFFFLRSPAGKEFRSRVALLSRIYRISVSLRLTQALCVLLSSGYTLAEALPACLDITGNTRVRRDLRGVFTGLSAGGAFWALLAEIRYMDPLFPEMARVGEETGQLVKALEKCREYFEKAQARSVQKLGKLIEPAVTLVTGALLGLLMLSVLLPTFALTDMY